MVPSLATGKREEAHQTGQENHILPLAKSTHSGPHGEQRAAALSLPRLDWKELSMPAELCCAGPWS